MSKKRMLLIEPDKILAGNYIKAFSKMDLMVDWSSDANSAIDLADKHKPDIVVCEIQLVGHSGIEFLYEFRSYSDWQKIPIIIFTKIPKSEFSQSQEILSKDLEINSYLYKYSVSLNDVLFQVSSILK